MSLEQSIAFVATGGESIVSHNALNDFDLQIHGTLQ